MRLHKLSLVPALLIIALSCSSCGPRMKDQAAIQPFEQLMPDMPENAVPVSGTLADVTEEQAELEENPLPRTDTNLKNGRIYYEYYCLMCHGPTGDADTDVAQGYIPRPADLSSPRIAELSDGEIYRRMLKGRGHEPVMDQTVHPGQRWPLVMYVRFIAEREHTPRQEPSNED